MGKQKAVERKIWQVRVWFQSNWQVLLFWLACSFAGWFLGAKGYGMALYFRLTGINPEEWTPLLCLTAERDPKIGSPVSLDGLTDWQGSLVKLPFPDKMTGLLFICGRCGLEETLTTFLAFQKRHADKMRLIIVYIGQPNAEFYLLWNSFKELTFMRDPQLKVFEHLNALYMPRFYLISPDGTLCYLSPLTSYFWQPERWQEELERISHWLLNGR